MKRVRIKVCGLREPIKAAAIARCGADAIGMVFADSPRWVSPEQGRAVADVLPPLVTKVGVFVDAVPAVLNSVAQKARLDLLQLHGDETPDMVEQLDRPVIKAFRIRGREWLDEVLHWLDGVATPSRVAAILLDAYKPGVHGGTGERFNWEWVADARLAGAMAGLPPVILSGGLDSKNVITAIQNVQPWAVDVSSGVESTRALRTLPRPTDSLLPSLTMSANWTATFGRKVRYCTDHT